MKNTILGLSPVANQTRRAADIVAALLPPTDNMEGAPANPPPAPQPKKSVTGLLIEFGAGVAGAVVGYKMWKKHPVLGALGGLAVGSSAVDIVKGGHNNERLKAVARLGITGAGVAGSLLWKKHPVLGYVGGSLVGTGATYFTPQTKHLWK